MPYRRFYILFSLFLVSAVLTGFSVEDNWKIYKHKSFTISYPANWKLDDSGIMNTKVLLKAPLESSQDDFAENVNVLTENIAGKNVDLEQYTEACLNLLAQYIENVEVTGNKRRSTGHGEFQEVIYTGELQGAKLTWVQHYYVTPKLAWVVTFSSKEKDFQKHKSTGMKILDSFTLK